MATDFSTATLVSQPAAYQHHAYKTSAHYNPTTSGSNTPMNSSPTSPRTLVHSAMMGPHAPQIRPPKNPIYVPAALRRTEKPSRQSPPKNDSAIDIPSGGWPYGTGLGRSNSDGVQSPISRIATEDIASIYHDTPLSPVSGPITKNHWMPDSSATVCSADTCQTPFGFFHRRHHCRKCGGIFCWQHSAKQIKLNELALFHPQGDLQRACDRCYYDFVAWEHARLSRSNSEDSGTNTAATPIEAPAMKRPEANRVGSLATSFQGAWNWSTF